MDLVSSRLLVSLAFTFSSMLSQAATVVAIKNGSWTNPETWSCACVPKRTDSIIIPQNIMVSINTPVTLGPSKDGEVLGITVAGTLNITSGSIYIDPLDRIVVLPGGKVNSKSFGGMIFSGDYALYLEGGTLVRGPVTLGNGFSPSAISDVSADKGSEGVKISWTSGTEIEVNFYNVYRSTDGTTYELVGKVDGRGSRKMKRYTITDENFSPAVVRYRIDLTNSNGVGATVATLDVDHEEAQESGTVYSEITPRHRE